MSESFIWSSDFETGLDAVDDQHHHLVDLINRFSEQVVQQTVTRADLATLLAELSDYTHYHFRDEEALMAAHGLSAEYITRHKAVHGEFIGQLELMKTQLQPYSPDDWKVLLNFLYQWLGHHILGLDQSMARQIRLIGEGSSPGQAWALEAARSEQDSVEPLLHALGSMIELLASSNADMKELNLHLEEKVHERTRELELANAKLEALSLTDDLTGLPNRRHAVQKLQDLWEESQARHIPLACMMIDADHFKEVNDEHGHDAGDQVLVALARILKNEVRSDDIVCRLGGDEFFIICPNTDLAGARHLGGLLLDKVRATSVHAGAGTWRSSISIGLAVKTGAMKDIDALFKTADDSLYQAKASGRGRVHAVQQG